jgi:cyanophycin synthetase
MSDAAPTPALIVDGPNRFYPGFVMGRRQPSLLVSVRISDTARMVLDQSSANGIEGVLQHAWREALTCALPAGLPINPLQDWSDFVHWLGVCTLSLLQNAGLPVFEPASVCHAPAGDRRASTWSKMLLATASTRPESTHLAWSTVLKCVNSAMGHAGPDPTTALLRAGLRSLASLSPKSANTPRLMKAAFELGIPVTAIGAGAFQYGHGRRAQWLDSTFTLQTSNISARLARDKWAAAARLRQAGIPVPAHKLVTTFDQAVQAADRLGYPVVVKPADQDGGNGVTAGLDSAEEIKKAFASASALSSRVLVEKHVEGRDYRLTVLDGQLLWAIERIPAGVLGDGYSTVSELVDRENADPLRRDGQHAVLKRLQLDDEALYVLDKQGLAATSIPAQGQFVSLRRIANVAAGGRPVAVLEQVHPDNALLALRAAEALRLDLAGIDLLMPDIARSWREVGAAICEVNAQPQLGATTGPHLYGEILRRRLPERGRIPIVIVVGEHSSGAVTTAVSKCLRAAGYAVGWCDRNGAGIDEQRLIDRSPNAFLAGHMLLTHPAVDALVLGLHNDELLYTGLPADRVHWLILAGTNLASSGSAKGAEKGTMPQQGKLLASLLDFAAPACVERIILLRNANVLMASLKEKVRPGCKVESMEFESLSAALRRRWPMLTA